MIFCCWLFRFHQLLEHEFRPRLCICTPASSFLFRCATMAILLFRRYFSSSWPLMLNTSMPKESLFPIHMLQASICHHAYYNAYAFTTRGIAGHQMPLILACQNIAWPSLIPFAFSANYISLSALHYLRLLRPASCWLHNIALVKSLYFKWYWYHRLGLTSPFSLSIISFITAHIFTPRLTVTWLTFWWWYFSSLPLPA